MVWSKKSRRSRRQKLIKICIKIDSMETSKDVHRKTNSLCSSRFTWKKNESWREKLESWVAHFSCHTNRRGNKQHIAKLSLLQPFYMKEKWILVRFSSLCSEKQNKISSPTTSSHIQINQYDLISFITQVPSHTNIIYPY